MSRYTVIVIDHEDEERAKIYQVEDHPIRKKFSSESSNQPTTKVESSAPARRYPNYDAVPDALLGTSKREEPESNTSKLRERLKTRITKPQEPAPKEKKQRKPQKTPKERFDEKMENKDFDSFTAPDLVYFFKHTAKEKNINYAINLHKDNAIMKKVQESGLSNREIIAMIEFLFYSKQDYLPKKKVSIGIFTTGWLNTIYQDSRDWLEDKYVPNKETKKKMREWTEEKPKEGTEVNVGWE